MMCLIAVVTVKLLSINDPLRAGVAGHMSTNFSPFQMHTPQIKVKLAFLQSTNCSVRPCVTFGHVEHERLGEHDTYHIHNEPLCQVVNR